MARRRYAALTYYLATLSLTVVLCRGKGGSGGLVSIKARLQGIAGTRLNETDAMGLGNHDSKVRLGYEDRVKGDVGMKRVVIISSDRDPNDGLIASVKTLFPDCQVDVVHKTTKTTEPRGTFSERGSAEPRQGRNWGGRHDQGT